jgi:hypothetical protein
LSPDAANAIAIGVNDRGEIAGIVTDTQEFGFLLVPE